MNIQKSLSPVTIGSRVLKLKQAEQLLPGFSRIADQIELFREEAKKIRETKMRTMHSTGERDDKYGEYYSVDNTISILGGRGSGKTSVMLTFKHLHSSNNKEKKIDIILPLIVPENISESNDTLGWFLGYLGEKVEDIEEDFNNFKPIKTNNFYNDQFSKCLHKDNSRLKDSYNRLLKSYLTRKDTYYDIIQGKNVGKAEYIRENEAYVHTDQRFGLEFNQFIDQLIDLKKQMNPSQEVEPLIMVFFDDVDISAERCPEALETIRKYFSHPNIVTFVSGDFNVFSEAMTIEFMKREKIEGNLYETVFTPTDKYSLLKRKKGSSALNQRKIRSQDYLKKVLPPSFRFEMKKMGNHEKANFSYPIGVEGYNEEQDIMLRTLLSEITNLSADKISIPYFRIFDENPRGLINPFYFLYQKRYRKEIVWNETDLLQFFNLLVNSSIRLREYRQNLEKVVQISLNSQATIIDYKYITNIYEYNDIDEKMIISEEEISEDIITLYLFADFFGMLFKSLGLSNHQIVNKEGVLVKILNNTHSNQNAIARIYPNIKNETKLIEIYQKLSEAIAFHNLRELFIKKDTSLYFEVKYYQILSSIDSNSKIINIFRETFDHDPEWVKQHIDFLFEKGRSFIELIDSNIEEFYQNHIFSKNLIYPNMKDYLSSMSLSNHALNNMIDKIKIISEQYSLITRSENLVDIIEQTNAEMLNLEKNIENNGMEDYEKMDHYENLWNNIVRAKIANEYQNKEIKKNHKILFENVIRIFDDLIDQAKFFSSLNKPLNFSEEHLNHWRRLGRSIPRTSQLSREIRNIIVGLMENTLDFEMYQENFERVRILVEQERVRKNISDEFFEDFKILSAFLQEENPEEDIVNQVRKGSLINCILEYAPLYIQLKSWVQNHDIQENDELRYFRTIKEQLRSKYENKRASISRFENYIIQKLEK